MAMSQELATAVQLLCAAGDDIPADQLDQAHAQQLVDPAGIAALTTAAGVGHDKNSRT